MSVLAAEQVLRRFFARESRRLARAQPSLSQAAPPSLVTASSSTIGSAASNASDDVTSSCGVAPSSSEASAAGPSSFADLQWTPATNPFAQNFDRSRRRSLDRRSTSAGRPLYSLRRQKMLVRALQQVQETASVLSELGLSADSSSSRSAPLGIDQVASWRLPPSVKDPSSPSSSSKSSKRTALDLVVQQLADKPAPEQWLHRATHQGPYKGRMVRRDGTPRQNAKPFKMHKWERDAPAVKAEREQKLASMPARIAEYVKTRAAAKAASRPTLPF